MENEKKFSTTTFGGFNKDDVASYIDSLVADHDEELSGLRDELDDANDKVTEFKKVVEQQYIKIVDATAQIERFVSENNELKARYTKITSQFAMISDAKLEAKRIVATAHEEARLVSENAKTQLFELAKRAKSMSEQSANTSAQVDNDAKEMAKQTIDDARKKETEILAYAKKEADDTTLKAREEAQKLIDEAKTKAEKTILRALEEAQSKDDEILTVAKRKAEEAYEEAKLEADKIIYEAQGKANDILLIAAQQAEQVLSDARKQANEILANTQKQADENVAIKEEEMLKHARVRAQDIVNQAEDKLKNADLVILDAESKLERVLTTESDILDGANKKASEIIQKAKEDARQLQALSNMERETEEDTAYASKQADEIIKKAKTLSQKALDDTKKEIEMKLKALAEQEKRADKIIEDAKSKADRILRKAKESAELGQFGEVELSNTPVDYEMYENCLQQIAVQRAKLLEILDEIKDVTKELPDYKRQDIQKEIFQTLDSNKSLNLVNSPKKVNVTEVSTKNDDVFDELFEIDETEEVVQIEEVNNFIEIESDINVDEFDELDEIAIVDDIDEFDEVLNQIDEVNNKSKEVQQPHIEVTAGTEIKKELSLPFKTNTKSNVDLPKVPVRTRARATIKSRG